MMGGRQKGIADREVLMVAEGLVETTVPIYWDEMGKTQTLRQNDLSLSLSLSLACFFFVFFYYFPQPGISAEGY